MKINKILAALAVSAGFLAVSCEDQPTAFVQADGVPTVHFVRYADRDILIEQAYMEETICIVGDNLRSVNQLWFNDQQAVLNTSYMTANTIVVGVPKEMAKVQTDKMYLITAAKDTVTYDFKVLAPAPVIKSMSCEVRKPGEVVTIYGDYFTEPLTLEFPNAEVTDFKSIEKTAITFTIPEGALPGKIKVTTVSGTGQSPFKYQDFSGLITDFDGTTDVVPQGWNIAATYSSEGGIDGQYVIIGDGTTVLNKVGAWNEVYKLPFWCGNWKGDPMSITAGPGIPLCNFIDFTNFKNMAVKFELNIPKENPWSSGAMQLVFVSAARCANDSWQNNTYIHTVADGGLGLCRGLYNPWKATGSFDTNGEWITVTVPLSEFTYDADGKPGVVPLSGPEDFASFILWPWSGGVEGADCTPIFKIDNIRVATVK